MKNHYCVKCIATGKTFADDGLILTNYESDIPSLLRAEYYARRLTIHKGNPGIFRFSDWLPVRRQIIGAGVPVTYKSQHLSRFLNLPNLYITFSGYWPEKGCNMLSGTFKECEAYAVCARFPADLERVLVVASAGNTARAFIRVAAAAGVPLLVVVPEASLKELNQLEKPAPWVKVIATAKGSDYYDAISLADKICRNVEFVAEGGAKNIARRDGMGTTVLSAAQAAGEIPDFYFQAIGSGTGAIAAFEANLRLLGDGRFGRKLMSLQLSQNLPFVPIFEAWNRQDRDIAFMDPQAARIQAGEIYAKVLANRQPPYAIAGGLYDALKKTDGKVFAVSSADAIKAQQLFGRLEGCDICPEAGVALASLQQAISSGKIDQNKLIMLNITGGGMKRLFSSNKNIVTVKPDYVFTQEADNDTIAPYLRKLYDEIMTSLSSAKF